MMPATTEILADQPVATRRRAHRHWLPALVLLPFVLLMILFQLAPMVWVLVGSFQTPDGWGLDYYREILSSPFYLQSFGNSLRIAGIASLAGLAIGTLGAAQNTTGGFGRHFCIWNRKPLQDGLLRTASVPTPFPAWQPITISLRSRRSGISPAGSLQPIIFGSLSFP